MTAGRRTAVLLAATLAVLLAGCGLEQDVAQRQQDIPGVGRPAPALSGRTIDGGSADLASLRGRPVVVDFWGSWCAPCRAEQPRLNAVYQRYASRVAFLGVDMRDDDASARAYVAAFGVRYASLSDPSSAAAGAFDVAAPPTSIVVDAQGNVAARFDGGVPETVLTGALDRVLAGAGATGS